MTEEALRGLFDHAGMFPPATKPFEDALRDAAGFAETLQRPAMVAADIVLPIAQWPRMDARALDAAGFEPRRKCKVALVTVPLHDVDSVAREVGNRNADRRGARTPVVSLELHFEDEPGRIYLANPRRAAPGVAFFVEPRWEPAEWRRGIDNLVAMLASQQAGLKFRCAGPTAVDHDTLDRIVRAAAKAKIPLKATQGLHHPTPREGHPFGFLGLLAAVRLRQAHGDRFDKFAQCLAEDDVRAFDLRDGIAWKDWKVTAEQLKGLPPFVIGTCSLEEPDQDLMVAFGAPA